MIGDDILGKPYLPDALPPWEVLQKCHVAPEILEAAEEIADGSDVIGLEPWRLEWMIRAALYLDRLSYFQRELLAREAAWMQLREDLSGVTDLARGATPSDPATPEAAQEEGLSREA